MNKKQILYTIIAIVVMIALDQVSKILVINNLALGQEVIVIKDFFVIGHIKNTGISYGGFSDASPLFFIMIYAVAIGVFAYLAKDINFNSKKLYSISLTMMIAGGIGNLLDRAVLGEVTDFLILIIFQKELFGIFNIADVFLVIGMVIFALDILFEDIIKWNKNS